MIRSRRSLCTAIAFVALLACAASCASPKRAGWDDYDRGDFAGALAEWKPLAEEGDADAQFLVGVMFDEGRGVTGDPLEAAKWYRRAAEQGLAPAQSNLGLLYYDGRGVEKSYAEAAAWFERAAEQGFARARTNRGVMYLFGQASPRDRAQALALLRLAAEQGESKAQDLLAAIGTEDADAAEHLEQFARAGRTAQGASADR